MATADFLCFRNCFLSKQTGEVTSSTLFLLLHMIRIKNKGVFFFVVVYVFLMFMGFLDSDLRLDCYLRMLMSGKLLLNLLAQILVAC